MRFTAVLITGLAMCLVCCSESDESPEVLGAAGEYYMEIALGSEFGSSSQVVRKWNTDLNVYISDTVPADLLEEFLKIRDEINALGNDIHINRSETPEQSNFIIYLSDRHRYVADNPEMSDIVTNNWGAFWLYWSTNQVIYRGHMYVDLERTLDTNCRKHLLREELTQALGLMQDSYEYSASIFYQDWTCGTTFSGIDREVIGYHLNPAIRPGMTATQVRAILIDLQNK